MKKCFLILCCVTVYMSGLTQDEKSEKEKGFKKENLFAGGSLALAFSNNAFTIGGSPEFGYSIAKWVDFGLSLNYNYTSYRDYNVLNDRLRQTVYGGGVFTRLFPVRFLYAQAGIEHNWIRLKYIPAPNSGDIGATQQVSGNSVLVGAGYTTGRDPDNKSVYGYLSVLFDVLKNQNSPYTDNLNRAVPIIRAGFVVPLFQGRGRR